MIEVITKVHVHTLPVSLEVLVRPEAIAVPHGQADAARKLGRHLGQLDGVLQIAGSGGDYLAAALDASTAYYAHTGTQTVARTLARHAVDAQRRSVRQEDVRLGRNHVRDAPGTHTCSRSS